ncbi:peptidoglycan binding protein CsiV [Photobacterium minamisatsumaniensis]|uniref:peptidoglycan binding protein CsiV n=1 Tax=Photobacterium minamisatsumaniensis TaxID=2910233 RepID=UPI003D0D795B
MKKLIYLLLLAISWPSLAARQFDIEVIMFKRNIAPEQVNESWPDQQKPINLKGTMSFGDSARLKAKGISLMSPSNFQLNSQYNKLKGHAGFTPLAHFGWRQGDLSRAAAPKFYLTAGKDFSDKYLPDGTSKAEQQRRDIEAGTDGIVISADNQPNATSFDEEEFGSSSQNLDEAKNQPLYELEGMIRVYVQHYLFTDINVDLREPGRREVIVGTESLEDTDPLLADSNVQVGHLQAVQNKVEVEEFLKSYRFDQQRQMRSGETHYIDHPLMGMVIQIRRIDN